MERRKFPKHWICSKWRLLPFNDLPFSPIATRFPLNIRLCATLFTLFPAQSLVPATFSLLLSLLISFFRFLFIHHFLSFSLALVLSFMDVFFYDIKSYVEKQTHYYYANKQQFYVLLFILFRCSITFSPSFSFLFHLFFTFFFFLFFYISFIAFSFNIPTLFGICTVLICCLIVSHVFLVECIVVCAIVPRLAATSAVCVYRHVLIL